MRAPKLTETAYPHFGLPSSGPSRPVALGWIARAPGELGASDRRRHQGVTHLTEAPTQFSDTPFCTLRITYVSLHFNEVFQVVTLPSHSVFSVHWCVQEALHLT